VALQSTQEIFHLALYSCSEHHQEPPAEKRHYKPSEEINTIPLADNNPSPEAKIIEAQEISSSLSRLDDELRALLIMKYRQGLSFEEIAEITGKTLSAVKMGIYRGLGKLKELMSEFGS
jgi:RNA polymerase sigma factor (sigma-70 family)